MRFTTFGPAIVLLALASAACGGAPKSAPVAPRAPLPGAPAGQCGSGELDGVSLHRAAGESVVRVLSGKGSGSGFVIGRGESQLVVTNYHVVAPADRHQAELAGRPGSAPRRVDLEVVRVDVDSDLALLRPVTALAVPGLELRSLAARVGESVAALGYPGVAGSAFALTLEPGTITSRRELDGRDRLQTNANINLGNSGGPILDRCGRVVGVVSARHAVAERVGLAVPASALEALIEAQRAPAVASEAGARSMLERFLKEVRFRRGERAAEFFGREFLKRNVAPRIDKLLLSAEAKVRTFAEERGLAPAAVGTLPASGLQELNARLSKGEARAVEIKAALNKGRTDLYSAARHLLELDVADVFGDLDDAWIEDFATTRKGCTEAYVTVSGKTEVRRYVVHLHHRWGAWVIDGVTRVR